MLYTDTDPGKIKRSLQVGLCRGVYTGAKCVSTTCVEQHVAATAYVLKPVLEAVEEEALWLAP